MEQLMFHDDQQFWFETLRNLGLAVYGGSDVGEVIATASRVTSGGYDRTDHDVARQPLAWLTASSPSLAQFEQQRAYLFGAGIPAAFLPGPAGLGRDDLV